LVPSEAGGGGGASSLGGSSLGFGLGVFMIGWHAVCKFYWTDTMQT
jgi:hypothetical protein